ncbi:MAG TPA: hypothetical protein VMT79_10505 [Candidatus Binatia bacterium]|nr:hypothetical protein [Candidatus Binatia bacterium]
MTPFVLLVLAGFVARLGYSMARSPVLPRFAQVLGVSPEGIGLIIAASTITGAWWGSCRRGPCRTCWAAAA